MINRLLALTVGIGLVLVPGGALASSPPAARPPKPAVPQLSDATLAEIRALVKGRSWEDFSSIIDQRGLTRQASITSARADIASSTAIASEFGKKYTPSPEHRADVLIADCGHASKLGHFDCVSLEMIAERGVVVVPFSYEAVTRSEKSSDGTTWKARVIEGRYPLDGLRFGFTIKYKSPDGKEWSYGVSSPQALKRLLLNLSTARAK
jgi:hypothetical protein